MRALLLTLALAAPAGAQRLGEVGFTVQDWGGLDIYKDSSRISDADAQVSSNVLTDRGFMEKRPGSVRLTDLSSYDSTVKQMGKFVDSTQVEYAIVHASNSVYSTNFGAAAVLVTTVAANATVDGVAAFSRYYISDRTTRVVEYNGTSSTTLFAAPIGQLMEFDADRLWIADIPAESGSLMRVSSFGGAGYWTVPANSADVDQAPDSFYFQREDGENITCLARTPWGMFVGKPGSSHIVKGKGNKSWRKVVIDPKIGCVDDRSVQMRDGRLTWLSRSGVYDWPGAGPPRWISQDIESLVKSIPQTTAVNGSVITDSQANFEAGNLTASGAGAPTSATQVLGSIIPSSKTLSLATTGGFLLGTFNGVGMSSYAVTLTSTVFEDYFNDGNATANPTWTLSGSGYTEATNSVCFLNSSVIGSETSVFGMATPVVSSTGSWTMGMQLRHAGDDFGNTNVIFWRYYFVSSTNDPATTQGYLIKVELNQLGESIWRLLRTNAGSETLIASATTSGYVNNTILTSTINVVRNESGRFVVSGMPVQLSEVTDTTYSTSTYNMFRIAVGPVQNKSHKICISHVYHFNFRSSGTYTSAVFDTSFSTPIAGPIVSSVTKRGVADIRYSVRQSSDNVTFGNWTTVTTATPAGLTQRYWQVGSTFTTTNSTESVHLYEQTLVAATTSTYRSAVSFINQTISEWGTFYASDELTGGGRGSYYTRASNSSFDKDAATPAWVAQTNLATISCSTGTYVQWRIDWGLDSGSGTARVDRVEWNYDGASVGPVASAAFDHRYYLCAAISSDTIDTCLVHQKNGRWTTITGPQYASLLDFGDELIAGGARQGYIWKIMQDGVYNDDGEAISALWVSKDFMFAPNGRDWATGEKSLNELWVDVAASSGTLLEASYAINKSTTYVDGTPLNLGAYGNVVNRKIDFATTPVWGKYFRFKFANGQLDKQLKMNAFSVFGEPNQRTMD